MPHEIAATVNVPVLFDPEPQTWGLRGDPWLWRDLRRHLAASEIPPTAGELISMLHAAFRELTGTDLTTGTAAPTYQAHYAHGGMSSGMISLATWRDQLMPLLAERAQAPLQHQAQRTSRDLGTP
jgi:hypothetical protein